MLPSDMKRLRQLEEENTRLMVGADGAYYENDQVSASPVAFGNGSHTLFTNTLANASFEYSGIVDQYESQLLVPMDFVQELPR